MNSNVNYSAARHPDRRRKHSSPSLSRDTYNRSPCVTCRTSFYRVAILQLAFIVSAGSQTTPSSGSSTRFGQPVLIVASTRTGSTMLMDLLSMNLDRVFTLSEPFHDYYDSALPGLDYNHLFDCSFASNLSVLSAVAWHGQGGNTLAKNIRNAKSSSKHRGIQKSLKVEWKSEQLQSKAEYIQTLCLQRKTRLIKTVRFVRHNAKLPQPLLDAGLKIIHLIRHPTNVAQSRQLFTNWHDKHVNLTQRAVSTCTHMGQVSISIREQIQDHHLLTVSHEELLKDPLGVLEQLYQFIGLPLTSEDQHNIDLELNIKHGPVNQSAHDSSTEKIPSELFQTQECRHLLDLGHYEV